jgi:hypothetical protein
MVYPGCVRFTPETMKKLRMKPALISASSTGNTRAKLRRYFNEAL